MIQFHHLRQNIQATLAMPVPDKAFFEQLLVGHANVILLPVGLTVKSEKDQFNKKLGREAAIKNITPVKCEFSRLINHNLKNEYTFQTQLVHNRKSYKLEFTISTVNESTKAYLISGYLWPLS